MSKSGLLSELLIGLLENNKFSSNFPGKSLVLGELLPGKPLVLQGNPLVLQSKWLVINELL